MFAVSNKMLSARVASELDAEEQPCRIVDLLRAAGLRPTRQRVTLARRLFTGFQRHVTADDLHQEVISCGSILSLAIVYNTLNQFADSGLLRRVNVEGERTWCDTDTNSHQHFYVQSEDRIIDIAVDQIEMGMLPAPRLSYAVSKVDALIQLNRIDGNCSGPKRADCGDCSLCLTVSRLSF